MGDAAAERRAHPSGDRGVQSRRPRAAAIQEITDPEAELLLPTGLLDSGSYRGRERVLRVWQAYVDEFDRFRWTVEEVRGAGERVFVHVREQGRGNTSGVDVDLDRYVVYTFRNGLVIRTQYCVDEATALEAVGLGEQAMSQENVELVRRNWELWSKGADDEVARQLAPDVEWHHQVGLGTPLEGIYRGREEVLGLSAAIRDSFGVARAEIEDVREISATEVLVLGSLHLEGRGSGAGVTTPFGAITEILEGLAVRQWFWTDHSKTLEAAGLRE